MKPSNLLIIMADELSPKTLGCYGHPLVQTPNLDKLARRGTRFTAAYTNSPICVPARASFATGRYVHENGCWDNAIAYDGSLPSWTHRLQQSGHPVESIGKLHYTSEDAPTGFDRQQLAMHIQDGVGDLHGSLREPLPVRYQSRDLATKIGAGETVYVDYDRNITRTTCDWLDARAGQAPGKPWTLFCSLMSPHFPLMAPQEYFDLYQLDQIEMPKERPPGFSHPWWDAINSCYIFEQYFESDIQRKTAIASYLGLCTFVDHCIGQVLDTLDATGLAENTRVLFVADHGDNLGARRLWAKSNMYEESAGVPMIIAGPGVASSRVVATPVSLVDVFPSVIECMGEPADPADQDLPGRSLWRIADEANDAERIVLSEYHAAGAISAAFMLRQGRYKYIHYVGFRPELYDLTADPQELHDLGESAEHQPVIARFEAELRRMLDPEAVDARAKADQAAVIARHGGREAILAQGGISFTSPPGVDAEYHQES